MSEHTPGPWDFEEFGDRGLDGPSCFKVGKQGWGSLARTEGYSGGDEANARLIAAAPELLEACMELLVSITEFGMCNGHDACCITQAIPFDPCDCGAEKARAAIAKARGAS